ncbi:Transposase family Tnp2 protein [Ceratobasidium sp. AG-Ba]|nr:Transposase family Tnp2 protein [Ceratobasidium sp. AG-Ba]
MSRGLANLGDLCPSVWFMLELTQRYRPQEFRLVMSLLNAKTQEDIISYYIDDCKQLQELIGTTGNPLDHVRQPGSGEDDVGELVLENNPCKLELEFLEEQFLAYSQAPLNIAELQFNLKNQPNILPLGNTEALDIELLTELLPAALPASKQFEYRARGYESLLVNLRNLECSSSRLDVLRKDFITIVSTELRSLLVEATNKLKFQDSLGSHSNGARRIHFVPPNQGRYWSPVVSVTVVLIAIIHCMMGVARDHCNLILKCLRCILQIAANLQNSRSDSFIQNHINPIPITLPTALHYLGLKDELDLFVVCPDCDSLYKQGNECNIPDKCSSLNSRGEVCSASLFTEQHRGNRTWKKPIRRYTHQPLESWLSRFLNRPGIEDLLESARPMKEPLCTDIWGGSYLYDFPGNGQASFFECPRDELRLAFLLYYDQFNYFTLKIAGKQCSSGFVMMVCLNLPHEVRYDLKNIYVTAMIPGPHEPGWENINKFMKPIIDNLYEHYESGVYISKTHKYPAGRKVQSVAPVSSMDIMAGRPMAGLGGPKHTIFCSFCNTPISEINNFTPGCFHERTMEEYQIGLNHWDQAKTAAERELVWKDHAVRRSEWSRFPWWNPFKYTVVAPMHWAKNVLEKQIRENMGASLKFHADDGKTQTPPLSRALTAVEVVWGFKAALHLSAADLEKEGLPEPLLRFICRGRGIYEAGLPRAQLIKDLNAYRYSHNILHPDGSPIVKDLTNKVAIAKAEYYLSKTGDSLTTLRDNSTVPGLQGLCNQYSVPWDIKDTKLTLMKRLVVHHRANITVDVLEDTIKPTDTRPLGLEIVEEVKGDMERTTLPSWIKHPPITFAQLEKIGAEEYKTIGLVSLPITLIRLWSTGNSTLRKRLTNFLNLSMAIRILSYQSLTEHDIRYFEYYYRAYLNDLQALYPFCSVVPVQHLGLHIPYFMRALGPPTRFSENTSEMFIGMLEDISSNSRTGEFEQTLHKELIMAANLKGMVEQWNFSDVLKPYSEILGEFLQTRYPGSERPSSAGWYTRHHGEPMSVDAETYSSLCGWAQSTGTRKFTRRLHVCQQLRRGNVVYQSFKDAKGNSCIRFRPQGSITAVPGRIKTILQEDSASVSPPNQPRIIVLTRSFDDLTPEDAANDPYRNNPIMGLSHFRIVQLCYDTINTQRVHIIQPDDIVSHVAVCKFADPDGTMSSPCSIILNLDLKHTFAGIEAN